MNRTELIALMAASLAGSTAYLERVYGASKPKDYDRIVKDANDLLTEVEQLYGSREDGE